MSSPGRGRGSPRRQQPGGPPPHGQQQQSAAAQRMGGYMQPNPYASQPQPLPQQQQQQQQYAYPRMSYPQHLQQPIGQPSHMYGQMQQPQQTSPYRGGPPGSMQHMQPSPVRNPYPPQMGMMPAGSLGISAGAGISGMSSLEIQPSYMQPRPGRLPKDRPIVKLSVSLIDTYKEINRVSLRSMACVCCVFFAVHSCAHLSFNSH